MLLCQFLCKVTPLVLEDLAINLLEENIKIILQNNDKPGNSLGESSCKGISDTELSRGFTE